MATYAADVTDRGARLAQGLLRWGPWLLAGALTVAFGWFSQARMGDPFLVANPVAVAVGLVVAGLAVALARLSPGWALALTWLGLALHHGLGTPITGADLGALWVAFAAARWGSLGVVWLSALSIPAAAAGLVTFEVFQKQVAVLASWLGLLGTHPSLASVTSVFGSLQLLFVIMFVVLGALLLLPWLLGMLLRTVASARQSRRLRDEAEHVARLSAEHAAVQRELAGLRASQTRLARDVHDAVGHSLAVVLAQAQSAQFLTDPEAVQVSLSQIAESARSSLQDVRAVLESTRDGGRSTGPPPREVDDLVEGVRRAGHEVTVEVVGTPRPLSHEAGTVLYRICQETLTNALRHGVADAPIRITQDWVGAALVLSVENLCPAGTLSPTGGSGIDGMRRRLDSVGGRLEAHALRTDGRDGPLRFVVQAWLPVSASA